MMASDNSGFRGIRFLPKDLKFRKGKIWFGGDLGWITAPDFDPARFPINIRAVILVVTLAAAGCSAPPIRYGSTSYPALSNATPVQVYMKDSDIPGSYTVVGTISAMDLGKYQMLTVQDSFPTLEKKALAIGATVVVIDSYQPVKSGILSTGYSVYGRAIRLGTPSTTTTEAKSETRAPVAPVIMAK